MRATLYLRPSPRTFYLVTETHALVFRQPESSESRAARSVVVAEFIRRDEVDMRGLLRASKGRYVEGVLGVASVPSDRSPIPEIFLVLISASSTLPPILPSSSLRPSKVIAVEFHSLSSSFWDPTDLSSGLSYADPAYDYEDEGYSSSSYHHPSQTSTQSQAAQQGLENPCYGMRKYLESGSFYFADDCAWDISTRMGEVNWVQVQAKGRGSSHPLETFDERFVWNANLLAPLLAFRSGLPTDVQHTLDQQNLLVPVIQGFCDSRPLSTGAWNQQGRPELAALGLISRLSWKRAGARFMTRGIDDDGQVANFVETELILATDAVCLSYVQVRGSVPLFWQQPSAGLGTLQQRVEITRPPQASQPAFDKHFMDLLDHYHSVHAINLLGQKDAESMLSMAYSEHMAALQSVLEAAPANEKRAVNASTRGTVSLTPYDFHAIVKADGNEAVKFDFESGLTDVVQSCERFAWTAIDGHSGQLVESQQGVYRANCLDCLDRTNCVQDVISSITLTRFLHSIRSDMLSSPSLWQAHRELWADNGDRLSKIYAGTGALNTSATRSGKKTFAGLLSDATKSVGRAYITNFQDKGKQNAIDLLLGMMAGQRPVILFDPIGDTVQTELASRVNEYSSTRTINLFIGTWNLNGKKPDEALAKWLFPPGAPEADIYSIAFQEIVELSPSQILQTDPSKRIMWENCITDAFDRRRDAKAEYLIYRSEQLVGTALIIVVRADMMGQIRRLESATKKTGLQGLSGNKGGVGIRFDLFDSSICLMTCHLAAGHGNVTERNADYRTISEGLKFLKGKRIDDHEIVIWAADFNYRIALPGPDVREHAEAGELDPMLAADQLMQAIDDGEVFMGYDEGPIRFRPTYKYDNGTDDYDTSEKQRIPAWTDRVLFKGQALRLKEYNRAELRLSDHKPVYATFEATIREVDNSRKDAIAKQILGSVRDKGEHVKLDVKVEKALNGGLIDLPKQMTNNTISPGQRAVLARQGALPRVPPQLASTRLQNSSSSAPTARAAPPFPSRSSPIRPGSASSQVSMSDKSPVPPGRGGDLVGLEPPSASIGPPKPVSYAARRKPAPKPPSNADSEDFILVSSANNPARPTLIAQSDTQVASSSLSVKKQIPPRLPPRSAPSPRASLDLNGSSPMGLTAPLIPDKVRYPLPSPSRPFTNGQGSPAPTTPVDNPSSSPPKLKPPPPIPIKKQTLSTNAPDLVKDPSKTASPTFAKPPPPPKPTRKPSGASRQDLPDNRSKPPVVPNKPMALRSNSTREI